jgi:glycoside/pentoside/hexuronide:cation symporter, GPH family
VESTATTTVTAPAVAPAREKQAFVVPRREKLGYSSFFIGQNILYIAVSTFLAVFYTGSLGIPAAAVGTLFLVARIWDALMDPIMATIVEKANLRRGKFKPWVMLAAITVPLFTVLCFGFGDVLAQQDLTVRIAYAAVTYLVWGTVFAAADAPAYAMATVMTPSPAERNVILTANQILGMVGILVGILIVPQLLTATGNDWFLTAFIFSAIGLVTMLGVKAAKERVRAERRQPPTIKTIFSTILSNKYLLLTVGMLLLSTGLNFGMALAPYLATDIFHDTTAASAILATSIFPVLIVAPFIPKLIGRFGKIPLLAVSFIVTAILSVVIYLTCRDSMALLMLLSLVKGFFFAPLLVMISLLFADSIEYDFFRKGERFEAATFAARTMATKAASAVSGGLALFLIGLAGYQASVEGQAVTQAPQALDVMWAAFNLGPAVGAVLAAVLLLKFYDLTEDRLKIMVEANLQKEQVVA